MNTYDELNLTFLQSYAKRWVETYPKANIPRVLLYRWDGRAKYPGGDGIKIKYAIVFDLPDITYKQYEKWRDKNKFSDGIGWNENDFIMREYSNLIAHSEYCSLPLHTSPLEAFIDAGFVAVHRNPGNDFRDEWMIIPKTADRDSELYDANNRYNRLVKETEYILYSADNFMRSQNMQSLMSSPHIFPALNYEHLKGNCALAWADKHSVINKIVLYQGTKKDKYKYVLVIDTDNIPQNEFKYQSDDFKEFWNEWANGDYQYWISNDLKFAYNNNFKFTLDDWLCYPLHPGEPIPDDLIVPNVYWVLYDKKEGKASSDAYDVAVELYKLNKEKEELERLPAADVGQHFARANRLKEIDDEIKKIQDNDAEPNIDSIIQNAILQIDILYAVIKKTGFGRKNISGPEALQNMVKKEFKKNENISTQIIASDYLNDKALFQFGTSQQKRSFYGKMLIKIFLDKGIENYTETKLWQKYRKLVRNSSQN